jgi:hypothetical protein
LPDPDNINIGALTFGEDYVKLFTVNYDWEQRGEINVTQIAQGSGYSSKYGKRQRVLAFTGFLNNMDETNKYNDFYISHLNLSNPRLYLIIKVDGFFLTHRDHKFILKKYGRGEFATAKGGYNAEKREYSAAGSFKTVWGNI